MPAIAAVKAGRSSLAQGLIIETSSDALGREDLATAVLHKDLKVAENIASKKNFAGDPHFRKSFYDQALGPGRGDGLSEMAADPAMFHKGIFDLMLYDLTSSTSNPIARQSRLGYNLLQTAAVNENDAAVAAIIEHMRVHVVLWVMLKF